MNAKIDPNEATIQMGVRITATLAGALDAEVKCLEREHPGFRYTRSEVARAILHRVLLTPAPAIGTDRLQVPTPQTPEPAQLADQNPPKPPTEAAQPRVVITTETPEQEAEREREREKADQEQRKEKLVAGAREAAAKGSLQARLFTACADGKTSQRKAAEAIGTNDQRVRRWLTGNTTLNNELSEKLDKYLLSLNA